MRQHPGVWVVILAAMTVVSACREEVVAPDGIEEAKGPALSSIEAEGELLGNVYDSTGLSTETNLYFDLLPADPATIAYLSGTNFNSSQWIDPSAGS